MSITLKSSLISLCSQVPPVPSPNSYLLSGRQENRCVVAQVKDHSPVVSPNMKLLFIYGFRYYYYH